MNSEQSTPYADGAWLYRGADWVGVIPVHGKYPPPSGWTGADGGWPSGADIQSWVDTAPAENIALRLPSDIIGIDVDAYADKRGRQTLEQCESDWGPLPSTWRSTSRDDGISGIRLYRVPEGLRFPGQLPGGGVELIKWDHRYCMAWPSIHPEGRTYRWTKDGVTAIGIPRPDELPLLPVDWLIGLVQGQWAGEDRADIARGTGESWCRALPGASDASCMIMVRQAATLNSALVQSPSSRHETLLPGLLNLVRTAEEGHPGIHSQLLESEQVFMNVVLGDGSRSISTARGEWTRALDGAVARVSNSRTWPAPLMDPCVAYPLSSAEPVTGALSGPQTADLGVAGIATPQTRSAALEQRVEWLRTDREARRILLADEAPPPDEIPTAVTLTEFLEQPDDTELFRVGSIMPIGSRVLLAAQMKAGKTTFIGNLIRSLVDGSPFLGAYGVSPITGRVTLIDNEMDARTLRRWFRDLDIVNADSVNMLSLIGRVNTFDIRIPEVLDYWIQTLAGMNTTTLILDCLKPILDQLGLDEHHDTGKITTPLTRLKVEAGISELILVHHMGHNNERSRGDSALRGWPEVEWHLVRLADSPDQEAEMDAPRFFKAYGRDVNVPESALTYSSGTRALTLSGAGSRKEVKGTSVNGRILALIAERPGLKTGEIEASFGGRHGALKDPLEKLIGAGILHRETKGKAQHHYPGPLFPLSPLSPQGMSDHLPPPFNKGEESRDHALPLDLSDGEVE